MSISSATPTLLDTTALVRVRAAVNPFGLDTVDLNVPEGLTIAQIFEIAQPDPIIRANAHVFIGEHYIPKENWHRVKPKAGDKIAVTIRAFMPPLGGDRGGGVLKNILRAVLVIGVLAASLFLGPALGGLIAPMGFLGMTSAGVGQAIIGAVGMMLVNMLVPPGAGKSDQAPDQTLFVEGARNNANPFGPVPVLSGRHKMVPKLATRPYTETVGDDQFLRMVFTWGIGPVAIDLDTLKIGETLLSEYDDYEIEHREGYADDDPLTLYPGVVDQEQLSVVLKQEDGATTRTASDGADELSVDLTFIQGLVKYNNRGKKQEASVQVEILYSVHGANTWLPIPFVGGQRTFPNSWINNLSSGAYSLVTFKGNKAVAIRYGLTWKVPTRGHYDIKIRRITDDHDPEEDKTTDEVVWTAVRRITNESPINSPVPIALTAIRIKATDQLNGVIDEFSGIVTRVALDWDSGTETWIERETRNPAAAFRFALQGHGLQTPYVNSKLDLESLAEWSEFCTANDFTYDYVQDGAATSLWDRLVKISAAGRATPKRRNGKIGVVIDKPSLPVSFVTPRNSSGFTVGKTFIVDPPHFFRVRFPNEEQDYKQDEQRVYINGYTAETGTRSEIMSFEGVTVPDTITRHTRFAAATSIHQNERWSFAQDMEYLAYSRGDVIGVTHDVLVVGKASGRIKSVTKDGSNNVVAITVDEDLQITDGDDFGVVIRTPDDAAVSAKLATVPAGAYRTVALDVPIPASAGVGPGDLFGFGIFGLESDEARVLAIEPETDLRAKITCVPYRPILYTIDGETIPPFDTKIIAVDNEPAPIVGNVYSIGPGTYLIPRIGISVVPATRTGLILEVQIQDANAIDPFAAASIFDQANNGVILAGVDVGDVVNIRLRWRGAGIIPTAWTYVLGFEVELVEPLAVLPAEVVDTGALDGDLQGHIRQVISRIPNNLEWLRAELEQVAGSLATMIIQQDELMGQIRIGAGAQYLANKAGVEINAIATAGINEALAQLFFGLFAINEDGLSATVGLRMRAGALTGDSIAAVDFEVAAGDGVNFTKAALRLLAYYSVDLGYYSEVVLEGNRVKMIVEGVELPASMLAIQGASFLTPIISNNVTPDLRQQRAVYETLLTGNITFKFPTLGELGGLREWDHIFRQDGTGGHTVTFDSEYRTTPSITLVANTMTIVTFRIVGLSPNMVVHKSVQTISLSGGDLPISRVIEYKTPGVYKLILPVHNTIKFEAWGPGAGGGNAGIYSTSTSNDGSGPTRIDFPASSLVAGGTVTSIIANTGKGGRGVRASGSPTGGAGATAGSGGDTNTAGNAGNAGQEGGTPSGTTGKGANAPGSGGNGGAQAPAGDTNGNPGQWPGGGGGGAWNTYGGDNIGGGAGSGSYGMRDEVSGVIKSGIEITITIPSGGTPATSGKRLGGKGSDGGVRITIT